MSQPLQPLFFEDDLKASTSKTEKKLTAAQRKSIRLKNAEYNKRKTEIREKKLVHRRLEAITDKLIKIKELFDANENEHDLFGKQVASSLKFLPPLLSIQLQNQIQNVINEFNQTHDISVPINMMSCTQNENREEEVEVPEAPTNDHNALESTSQGTPPTPLLLRKIPSLPPMLNNQQIRLISMNTQQTLQRLPTNNPQLIGQFILGQSQKPLVLEVGPLNSMTLKPLVTNPSTTIIGPSTTMIDKRANALVEDVDVEGDSDSSDGSEDEEIEIKEEPLGEIDVDEGDPLQNII